MSKTDTELMKILLNSAKFKQNEAIGNTKVKVDAKLIRISVKMC